MFKFFIYFLIAATAVGMIAADDNGFMAFFVAVAMSIGALTIFRRITVEKEFVTYIFLAALSARLVFGIVVHLYDLRDFVGPDSFLYDMIGSRISDYWLGHTTADVDVVNALSVRGPGWGMHYLVGIIYVIAGKSILTAQTFCAVIGAATAPMTYLCSERIFHNQRAAKAAAFAVAFFPAFIIWSSQLLKDGLIVFLLVVAMTVVMRLHKQFTVVGLLILVFSLFGILSLRFYIFFMMAAAVAGSFIIGVSTSFRAIFQRTAILLIIGLALTYLGVIRTASLDFETYGSLERIQVSRADISRSGESGYGEEQNVSTIGGALAAVPQGFAVLMFAPFPWEMKNLRQSLTLPEVLLWWAMIPLLVYGLWYTMKNRLRESFPILIFTLMLTISYSIFQGNLGAAYRQRTQIQVFLFMFIAVGWALIREKMEDRRVAETARRNNLNRQLKARFQERQKAT